MGRSLGLVVVGWCSGFLIAIAWGVSRANHPRLASMLSGWVIAGLVVTAVLLLSIAITNRVERWQEAKKAAREAARAAAVDADPQAALRAASASTALDPNRMTVRVQGRDGPGSRVQVEVTYVAPTDVPLVGGLLGDVTLYATATMRVE